MEGIENTSREALELGNHREPSWLLYGAVIGCHMASISMGSTFGWTAPSGEQFITNSTSLRVHPDSNQQRLIASILTLGALAGGLTCGFFLDRFGRRRTLIALGVPFAIGWVLIGVANSVWMILLGRTVTGLASGVAIASVPTYLAEISPARIRGNVGMTMNFFVVFGILYMSLMALFDYWWNQLALWALLPTILLSVIMFFMPESPVWCVNCIDDPIESLLEARKNLSRLRSNRSDIDEELDELVRYRDSVRLAQLSKVKLSLDSFTRPDLYKPMLIGILILFFQQFCGVNALQFYMNDIFRTSGSSLSPKQSTFITNGFMLLGTVIGGLIIERFGRRLLLIISAFGMMISMAILGWYYYQYHQGDRSILPIVCLSVFVASFAFGIGPIAWIIITELTPPQTVGIITSVTSVSGWLFTFFIVNQTPAMFNVLHEYGTYWLFSIICLLCVVFVWFLPETKGRTIEEIGRIFGY